jgi:hypothetical protein
VKHSHEMFLLSADSCNSQEGDSATHLPPNFTVFHPSSALRSGLTRRLRKMEKALGDSNSL